MGSSSSKASRTLPKRVKTTPWSGARAPRPVDPISGAASELKNEAIEQDSKDPHFLSKLNELGPVRVDHGMHGVRPANHLLDSRVRSEEEAAESTTPNRVQASRLGQLLDERKSIRTKRDLEFLAKRFGVDLEQLEAISKFVSTPSVRANSSARVVQKEDEKRVINAVWIEPQLRNPST